MTLWLGQRIARREDPTLLRGAAQYLADLADSKTLHVGFVRSTEAHADIVGIDTETARGMPGVHAVVTAADLPADLPAQPSTHDLGTRPTPYYALTAERVRHVGEPVAAVVGESAAEVADAADAVDVRYSPRPAITTTASAIAAGAPTLFDDWPDNVAGTFDIEMGDAEAALDAADVVVTEQFTIQRQTGCPLEGRGALARWEASTGRLELWTSTQSPHIVRDFVAEVTGVPEHMVHVKVPAVGGAFGVKFHYYVEESAVALLAKLFDRPVLWSESRGESFVASVHAREQLIEATIGAQSDGTITVFEADIVGDMGAYMHTVSFGPVWLTSVMMTNAYEIPNARSTMRAVVSNKTPSGSYRGWGQPQANFVVERMVDRLAAALSMDPAVLRRRNLVPPDRFPYTSLFHTFDSGRYGECLDRGLELGRYEHWREYQAEQREAGRHVGIGLSFYVENTALGPSRQMNEGGLNQGGYDIANIRMEPGGEITVFTGLCEMGQGFTNGLGQLAAETIGVHLDQVTIVSGDTEKCPYTGHGTGASRSAAVGGAAVLNASKRVRERIETIAAHMLEAAPEDLIIENGVIWVNGSPSRTVTTADVGRAAYLRAIDLPPDMAPGLEVIEVFDPPQMAWPYGLHVVVVDVDVETGGVEILDYALMHDCGTMLNPMIVEGQLHGGVAQGIAAALLEELQYDDAGEPLTTSFADYLIPSAVELPNFHTEHMTTPSPIIPGGMKGVGEAGIIGPPAAIVNAIEDALGPDKFSFTKIPLTPQLLWREYASKSPRTNAKAG